MKANGLMYTNPQTDKMNVIKTLVLFPSIYKKNGTACEKVKHHTTKDEEKSGRHVCEIRVLFELWVGGRRKVDEGLLEVL